MGTDIKVLLSRISRVLWHSRMRSIGMLDTHNRTVSFETLVLLKTLKIRNQYPRQGIKIHTSANVFWYHKGKLRFYHDELD